MAQKPRPIVQHRGPLSPQQVADGMNAAARNAKDLFEDATLLLRAKRYPRACSLAVLSIEESGKLALLRAIAGVTDSETLKSRWRDYRDHKVKNAIWIITGLAAKGATTLDDLSPIFDENSDHQAVLDAIKQLGFYTDCYGSAYWSEPFDVIEKKLAEGVLFAAKILIPKREVTAREIELWIEHVMPHWGSHAMRQGAVDFHQALKREGLSDFTDEQILTFYGVSPSSQY
jgi:AbiV family abortive infection protein